jgi:hypothetical protein
VPTKPKIPRTTTLESSAYLDGLFHDFDEQLKRYQFLSHHHMELEARLDLAEKTLCLTRDHLEMALKTTEGNSADGLRQFREKSARVRFVGMRLTDACAAVLKEHKKITPEKLLNAVNEGTFRFRTNAPLREIHAALLRHPHVERIGDHYVWTAPKEEQIVMALPRTKRPAAVPADEPVTRPKMTAEVKPN